MIQKTTSIQNQLGLHARASMKLINAASRFQSHITITYNNKTVDVKDIMQVMGLTAANEAIITLTTEGEDEEAAMDAILSLVSNKFDEDE
jgi:phosphocarrier protein